MLTLRFFESFKAAYMAENSCGRIRYKQHFFKAAYLAENWPVPVAAGTSHFKAAFKAEKKSLLIRLESRLEMTFRSPLYCPRVENENAPV